MMLVYPSADVSQGHILESGAGSKGNVILDIRVRQRLYRKRIDNNKQFSVIYRSSALLLFKYCGHNTALRYDQPSCSIIVKMLFLLVDRCLHSNFRLYWHFVVRFIKLWVLKRMQTFSSSKTKTTCRCRRRVNDFFFFFFCKRTLFVNLYV